jgi:hypothetical protein
LRCGKAGQETGDIDCLILPCHAVRGQALSTFLSDGLRPSQPSLKHEARCTPICGTDDLSAATIPPRQDLNFTTQAIGGSSCRARQPATLWRAARLIPIYLPV